MFCRLKEAVHHYVSYKVPNKWSLSSQITPLFKAGVKGVVKNITFYAPGTFYYKTIRIWMCRHLPQTIFLKVVA